MSAVFDAALGYARRGWRVTPSCNPAPDGTCGCGRKIPHTGTAIGKATILPGDKQLTEAARVFRQKPDANVALLLEASSLVSVDCDGAGATTEATAKGLPPTPTLTSRPGHEAFIYTLPPGVLPANSTGRLTRTGASGKIDILARGIQIVPPSVHRTGSAYKWLPGRSPDEVPVAPAPPWVIDALVNAPKRTSATATALPDDLPPVDLATLDVDEHIRELIRNGGDRTDRSRDLFRVELALIDGDCDDATIAAILLDPANGISEKPREQGRNWLATEIARVREKHAYSVEITEGEDLRTHMSLRSHPLGKEDQSLQYNNAINNKESATACASPSVFIGGATEASEATKGADSSKEGWPPPLAPEAYHGLAGLIVRTLSPHSEADPAALLMQVLVAFGNLVGRSAYFIAESDRHCANLYVVLVGETAKARKGSSWGQVRRVFSMADPAWVEGQIRSGLSSGEGLMMPVRDHDGDPPNGGVVATDKRLLVMEPEFASALRVMTRDANTLSAQLRQAWDTGDLATMVRHDPVKVTGAHISLIGHITKDELRATLTRTDTANGFANRILWVAARRSKCLPDGGTLRDGDLTPLATLLAERARWAKQAEVARMSRSEAAREVWHAVYPSLSEGKPGLLGPVISRAEAQVMRLAVIYSLLDGRETIARDHLLAALAVWDYCEATARFVFGHALGDPIADEILHALRNVPQGLTRTGIRDLFGRHRSGDQVGRALALLLARGLATCVPEQTPGRPAERWSAKTIPADTITGWPYLDLAKRCEAENPEVVEGIGATITDDDERRANGEADEADAVGDGTPTDDEDDEEADDTAEGTLDEVAAAFPRPTHDLLRDDPKLQELLRRAMAKRRLSSCKGDC